MKVAALTSIVLLSIGFAWPINYPDTLRVPVTFYDFHSNGSNPEFGIDSDSYAGTHTGMVSDTISEQRKPIRGLNPYYNCDIAKWFMPWTSGDSTIPNYTNPATAACGNPPTTTSFDTAFKNIVIEDTLTFRLVDNAMGTYEYSNPDFFPLDGRGFGNEGAGGSHNYSFAMEMHWEFKDVKGLTYTFESNNDMWVYINGRLAIDLGGIHSPSAGSINFDSVPGLTIGRKCSLDMFYAQRRLTGSAIKITTSIFAAAIISCDWLIAWPIISRNDTVVVGDSVVLSAMVFDDTCALRPDLSSLYEWTLSPGGMASSLSATQGETTTFYAMAADQMYTVIAYYTGPVLPGYHYRSPGVTTIYVKPSSASIRREQIPTSQSMDNLKVVREFYNISGRKLPRIGSSRIDGIVLERTVFPGGKVSVKRKFRVPDCRF